MKAKVEQRELSPCHFNVIQIEKILDVTEVLVLIRLFAYKLFAYKLFAYKYVDYKSQRSKVNLTYILNLRLT